VRNAVCPQRTRSTGSNASPRSFQRTHQGPPLQRCAISDCTNVPTNGIGVPVEIDVRRWHCPAHEHLAGPGDLEPHGSGLRYPESGAIVPIDPGDDAREQARAESERRQREPRAADSAVEAAAADEHRRARDEALQRELPDHLRGLV
jgi:hypothetical protein